MNVLIIIVILILVGVVIHYITKDVNTLSGLTSGETVQKIEASSLATTYGGDNASNYSYSIWIYIDNWNYKYNDRKPIFARGGGAAAQDAAADAAKPCPAVVLGAVENNMEVMTTCYAGDQSSSSVNTTVNICSVQNVPIQKWTNVIVSVYGRTQDVYLDGKLVRTCVLPGVAYIDSTQPVYITPNGGFSGWTSRFQYFAESMDPQHAWNIYKAGYGGSWLGNIFGKYQVKISLMEGHTETKAVQF